MESRKFLTDACGFAFVIPQLLAEHRRKGEQFSLVFRKMHDQANEGAVNIAGKTNTDAALVLTNNPKSGAWRRDTK